MLFISKQKLEDSAIEARTYIQLDSLNIVKDILASTAFTNDEKVHLIESRFIVEKAEMAELDEEVENTGATGTLFGENLSEGSTYCTAGDTEPDVPVGQMTLFEFLGANAFPEEKTAETIKNEVPEEIVAFMQELTSVLHAAFGK